MLLSRSVRYANSSRNVLRLTTCMQSHRSVPNIPKISHHHHPRSVDNAELGYFTFFCRGRQKKCTKIYNTALAQPLFCHCLLKLSNIFIEGIQIRWKGHYFSPFFMANQDNCNNGYYHSMLFFFLFTGWKPTLWPSNNCFIIHSKVSSFLKEFRLFALCFSDHQI